MSVDLTRLDWFNLEMKTNQREDNTLEVLNQVVETSEIKNYIKALFSQSKKPECV